MRAPVTLILDDAVSIQDLARALQYTGFAVSNTVIPSHFVIKPTERRLPENVVDLSAFHRRQAE
jgi:hypothetical protein